MANNFSLVIIICLFLFYLISTFCHCFNPKQLSETYYQPDSSYDSSYGWATTDATWYGAPNGAGSDGGACGYKSDVESAPFNSLITAVSPSLFSLGCGECYQIKCTSSEFCSGNPVTVVATDSCPGCDHDFDLSGTSFGAMANSGDADSLRNLGRLQIQYTRVNCNFGRVDVTFRVDPGSNPSYLAFAVEFEDGRGISGVAIRQANSKGNWISMSPLWGAVYMVNLPSGYTGPFSVQLTDGPQTIVAENVIPQDYEMDVPYTSSVNFNG